MPAVRYDGELIHHITRIWGKGYRDYSNIIHFDDKGFYNRGNEFIPYDKVVSITTADINS